VPKEVAYPPTIEQSTLTLPLLCFCQLWKHQTKFQIFFKILAFLSMLKLEPKAS